MNGTALDTLVHIMTINLCQRRKCVSCGLCILVFFSMLMLGVSIVSQVLYGALTFPLENEALYPSICFCLCLLLMPVLSVVG